MRNFFFALLLLTGAACTKKDNATSTAELGEGVDNSATRYVGGLQTSVQKADKVTDRANQNIKAQETQMQEVQKQVE